MRKLRHKNVIKLREVALGHSELFGATQKLLWNGEMFIVVNTIA